MRKIPLQFSDIDFGTEEFGFIPVEPGEDPDDADRRYERHLAAQGVTAQVDPMGNLVVEGAGRRGTLRLTEGELRRIVREEVRALREAVVEPDYETFRRNFDRFTSIGFAAAQDVLAAMGSGGPRGGLRALVDDVAADFGIDPEGVEEHLLALSGTRLIDRAQAAAIARELAP